MDSSNISRKTLQAYAPTLLLFCLAFALFANTFLNGWTYDDFPVIVENPDITSWTAFLKDSYPSRPLREITYLLDYALFGLNPEGWHIQNIFWHGLNAVLLFCFTKRVTNQRHVAWLTSLLFLLHPIQVEVVANISHRKDSLALAFSLIATLLYLRFIRSGRMVRFLFPSLLSVYIACLAKQNAIVLPLVFAACEAALFPPKDRFILRSKRLALSSGAIIASVSVGWFFWGNGLPLYTKSWPLLLTKMDFFSPPNFEVYLLLLLKSWAFMLFKLIFPTALGLEYTYAIPASWLDPWIISSLSMLLGYVALLIVSFKRNKVIFFFLVWAGLFWLPTSNIWPISYFAADRYWYAPSVGIFAVFSIAVTSFVSEKKWLLALTVPILLLFAYLTWQQNRVWFSPETLWIQANKVSPTSSFALNNLGNVYLLKNNLFKAQEFYREAAKANPTNPTSYYNQALIYERIGDKENAIKNYRIFLSLPSAPFQQQAEALRGYLLRKYGIIVK